MVSTWEGGSGPSTKAPKRKTGRVAIKMPKTSFAMTAASATSGKEREGFPVGDKNITDNDAEDDNSTGQSDSCDGSEADTQDDQDSGGEDSETGEEGTGESEIEAEDSEEDPSDDDNDLSDTPFSACNGKQKKRKRIEIDPNITPSTVATPRTATDPFFDTKTPEGLDSSTVTIDLKRDFSNRVTTPPIRRSRSSSLSSVPSTPTKLPLKLRRMEADVPTLEEAVAKVQKLVADLKENGKYYEDMNNLLTYFCRDENATPEFLDSAVDVTRERFDAAAEHQKRIEEGNAWLVPIDAETMDKLEMAYGNALLERDNWYDQTRRLFALTTDLDKDRGKLMMQLGVARKEEAEARQREGEERGREAGQGQGQGPNKTATSGGGRGRSLSKPSAALTNIRKRLSSRSLGQIRNASQDATTSTDMARQFLGDVGVLPTPASTSGASGGPSAAPEKVPQEGGQKGSSQESSQKMPQESGQKAAPGKKKAPNKRGNANGRKRGA